MSSTKLSRQLALLLCPLLAAGQAPQTTIEVTSRIVYVDVVVRDSSGHIVRGLTQKDFRIFEEGKAQHIDFFGDHSDDATKLVSAAAASGPRDPLSFSNVDASGSEAGAVNIILFDFFNTAPQDYSYAKKQMIRFLEQLPSGRQTALFVLGARLEMLQSFTGSTDRLLAAAKAMQMGTSTVEMLGEQQQDLALAQAFARATGRSASGKNPVAEQNTLAGGEDVLRAPDVTRDALNQIGAAVSGYPGRKNLYWLGETFPVYGGPVLEIHDASQAILTHTMSTQDIADANRAEATAQIAIYPISLAGLEAGGIGPESNLYSPNGAELTRQFYARNASHAMLNNLADTTGGHAYYSSNDLAGALQRGFEDGSSYYEIAYRPENHKWDGKFRNISIKMERSGYSLSYRRGYFAVPDATGPAAATPADVIAAAMQPDTPQETILRLNAKVELPNTQHTSVRVSATIGPENVAFHTDEQGRHHARLVVTLAALPDDPKVAAKTKGAIPKTPTQPPQASGIYVVDLDDAAFQKLLTGGMPMRQELTLPPGRYRLRLAVCDLGNRRIGTLDMPVVVAGPGMQSENQSAK